MALVICAAAYHLFPKASPEGDDESRVSVFAGEAVCQVMSVDEEETSLLVLPE